MCARQFILSLLTTLLPIAAATSSESNYGQYFCVVEHVAGLTLSYDGENRRSVLSGKVNIPDSDTKFFIKIAPKQYSDIQREICAADVDYWPKKIEQGIAVSQPHTLDQLEFVGHNCFASDEVAVTSLDGKIDDRLSGYGGDLGRYYYGSLPADWFAFTGGDEFQRGVAYDNGPVVEYGHCTKLEPPK